MKLFDTSKFKEEFERRKKEAQEKAQQKNEASILKTTEPTFILQKGEKIIKEIGRCQYSGVTQRFVGSMSTFNANEHLGGALYSGKQVKREGSAWDAKYTHIYLTNKRIVFCNIKVSLFRGTEKSIGTPFLEIPFNIIKGINSNTKLMNPAIDLSIMGKEGIDNVKFWLLGTQSTRGKERDEFLTLIKKQI